MKKTFRALFFISAVSLIAFMGYATFYALTQEEWTSADMLMICFGGAIVVNLCKTFGES
jgi:hypothetical protein